MPNPSTPANANTPPLIQAIGIASIVCGVADPLLTVLGSFGGPDDSTYGPVLEHLGRIPIAILLLAGGIGVLHAKPWSRFVYWLLPIYSMIVTLVLMPAVVRSLPAGGDLWDSLRPTSLYWPIVTALLYPVAFIVSNYFWNIERSRLLSPADRPPEGRQTPQ